MNRPSTTEAAQASPPALVPDARLLGQGLAALRIFVGLIALLNGLAKVFGWHAVQVGPYVANLINRDDARFILEFEVFRNAAGGRDGTRLPLLRDIAQVMLDNWAVVGWTLTLVEVSTGLLLVLGLAARGAALVALGMHLFLAAVYFTSDRWLFEQPHEYVPLLVLTVVPAGRVWGLDGWAALRTGRTGSGLRSWPF